MKKLIKQLRYVERKCRAMAKKELEPAAKAVRNAYMRAWRAKNPDKVKEINDRYWRRKAEQLFINKEALNNTNK